MFSLRWMLIRVAIILLEYFKSCATKSKKPISRETKIKPWITLDLIKAIRRRDKLSKIVKRQPFNQHLQTYFHNFRNKLSKDIRHAKTSYFKTKIVNSK